jgi:KDO2-lipid IV(A) lauroyltransferase
MTSLVSCLLWALATLPRKLLQTLGKFIGWLNYQLCTRSAKISQENISLCCPELLPLEQSHLVRQSLQHTAQTMLETPAVWLGSRSRLESWIVSVSNEALLTEAIKTGKGVIVLLPHLGNWELFNVYFARHGSMTALYHPPRQLYLQPIMRSIRERFGNELVATNKKGIVRLFRSLEAGGVVTILPDQVPTSGVFSDFFGMQALTDVLIPRLVSRTGASVVAVTVQRSVDGRFTIVCQEPEPEIYSEEEELAVQGMNKTIERCVRGAPAQYQWEYKRFRQRPLGEKKIYRFNKPEEYHLRR